MSQLKLWSDGCADAEPDWMDPDDGLPARYADLRGQLDWRQIAPITTVELAGSYL